MRLPLPLIAAALVSVAVPALARDSVNGDFERVSGRVRVETFPESKAIRIRVSETFRDANEWNVPVAVENFVRDLSSQSTLLSGPITQVLSTTADRFTCLQITRLLGNDIEYTTRCEWVVRSDGVIDPTIALPQEESSMVETGRMEVERVRGNDLASGIPQPFLHVAITGKAARRIDDFMKDRPVGSIADFICPTSGAKKGYCAVVFDPYGATRNGL